MAEAEKAKKPFHFHTRLLLSELTGLRASNLNEFLYLMEEVPDSCIYHHTHRFLQQHQYISPAPNDFALWVEEALSEDELSEKLASIDTIDFSTIKSLREKIISTIEEYLKKNPISKLKFARKGKEFDFVKSVSFIVPTEYKAHDISEFIKILKKITIDSIYFHIFEARLRLDKSTNDFSYWFETSVLRKDIGDKIAKLDPYTYNLENLRTAIIDIIEKDRG